MYQKSHRPRSDNGERGVCKRETANGGMGDAQETTGQAVSEADPVPALGSTQIHIYTGAHGAVYRTAPGVVTKRFNTRGDFEHETRILRMVHGYHGFVQILACEDVHKCVSMEDGGEALYDLIVRDLPLHNWHDLHCQTVSAIGVLHSMRVVHGDIKADNILVDKAGVVRLCDFGFAVALSDHGGDTACVEGRRGTREYASPEVMGGEPYDPFAADAWSLGVVLIAMVCGVCPFVEASSNCATYRYFSEAVVRDGVSPAAALAFLGESEWSTQTMRGVLFVQNLDMLLQPVPSMRVAMHDPDAGE